MFPKTRFIPLLIALCLSSSIYSGNTPLTLSPNSPTLHVSFDECVSFFGQSSLDYSEFTAVQSGSPECSSIEMGGPDHVFRGQNYGHSCTPGIGNTSGMCIEGFNQCFYDPGNPAALKFNVKVIPGPTGFGSIDMISFFEQAPDEFAFNMGDTGPNNYPTKLGVRVLVDDVVIYDNAEFATSRTWTLEEIDFRAFGAFTVSEETIFNFELLPYCPVGNGAEKMVWDIDELTIKGGCNNINGGTITTSDNLNICLADGDLTNLTFDVTDIVGTNTDWLVENSEGVIVGLSENGVFDFDGFENGVYNVFHIVYENDLSGLELQNSLMDLTGCFDLSNGLRVTVNALDGGRLTDQNGFLDVFICDDTIAQNLVELVLSDAVGTQTTYLLTDNNGLILQVFPGTSFDFSPFSNGEYQIIAVAHNGTLLNNIPGNNLTDLLGCFELSNALTVQKDDISVGSISFQGMTMIDLCGNEGMMILPEVDGEVTNPKWITSLEDGTILQIDNFLPIDITTLNQSSLEIRVLSSIGRVNSLEVNGNINDFDGCFEISNAISINNENIGGGTIDVNGSNEIFVCANDSTSYEFSVNIDNVLGSNTAWTISDTLGEILVISDSPDFNFENIEPGVCWIRHISFTDMFTGLEVGNSEDDFSGCYDFSNTLFVNRVEVVAGEITSNLGTEVAICSGDGNDDILDLSITGVSGPSNQYVVTEANGAIIEFLDGAQINFEGVPDGLCLIYNIVFDENGSVDLNIDNINDLAGCAAVSNAITVTRNEVNGGQISVEDGADCVPIIVGDNQIDSLDVQLDGNIGENSSWVLTDLDANIIGLPSGPPFGLDSISVDTALIWHLSFDGMIMGAAIEENASNLSGCFDLSNSIKVAKQNISAGQIATTDGETNISICLGDGQSDELDIVLSGNLGENFGWIITDDQGNILELPSAQPFDFSNAGNGICNVYHISFLDGLMGLEVNQNISNLDGAFDLSDPIIVNRSNVDGGVLSASLNDGPTATEFEICSGDGQSDILTFTLQDTMGILFQWIVTDTTGTILNIQSDAPSDFEAVPEGVCWIYHVSHLPGIVGLEVGNDLDDLSGCFSLSNNITITRNEVNGGVLSSTTGADTLSIIVGDLVGDTLAFSITGSIGNASTLLVTDTLGNILVIPDSLSLDFNDFETGTCLVWNLTFLDMLPNISVGDNASDLTGCFDLSNPITLIKEEINGGVISTADATDLCLSDLVPDSVDVTLLMNTGTFSSWVITDDMGEILALPMTPPFDFSGAGNGVCQIWHLAHEDNLQGLSVGNNVSGLTGTFEFSNSIEVNRTDIDGGTLLTSDNQSNVMIMVDDGIPDIIDFITPTVLGADTSVWVVTDTLGQILSLPDTVPIDFEDAGDGVCLVWYLSFVDQITGAATGNNVSDIMGCFALSSSVTVERMGISGGNLMTSDGLTQVSFCVGDGESDLVEVVLTDTIAPMHDWVITDDQGLILALPQMSPFEFDTVATGTCQIWNIGYNPNVMGLEVGNNVGDLTGNFQFSNPITVFRSAADASILSTTSGATEITVTVGDNIPELVGVTIMGGAGDNSSWAITDTVGMIIEVPAGPPFNFEDAPEGVCQIWNINHGDGLIGLEAGNNLTDLEGCFAISNAIEVTREELVIEGGSILFDDGSTVVDICAGDGLDDILGLDLSGSSGLSFQYVITDTTGVILGLPPGGGMDTTINLENAPGGISRIWHLAYASGLTGLNVGLNVNDLNGLFDFSNFLTVNLTAVDGGNVSLPDGSLDTLITLSDGVIDSIFIDLASAQGDSMRWVITNLNGEIISLPDSLPLVFENAGAGTCQVWNLSISGLVTGVEVGNNITDIVGCHDFSTDPVTVLRVGISGGNIATAEGATTTDLCFNGSTIDPLDVVISGNSGSNQQWVITDDADNILELPMAPPFDFTSAGVGTCKVYHIAFETGLMGLNVGESLNSISGNFSLSNSIEVNRFAANGGMIETVDGLDTVMVMINDMMPDTVDIVYTSMAEADSIQFISTDASGIIVAAQDSSRFIFENQGGGTCQIWSIAYADGLTGIEIGNNVSSLAGCFALSNPVTVIRSGINGGDISTTTGVTEVFACVGDGEPDEVDITIMNVSGTNQQYMLVNNGVILQPQAFPPFNFETFAGVSTTIQIYSIAFEDDLMGLTAGQPLSGLSGTFDLSNPITVDLSVNSVGLLFGNMSTSLNIIVGEGVNDSIFMNMPAVSGDTTAWLIIDTNNNILELPDAPPFILEDATTDTCFIHLMSYSFGLTGLEVGNNLSDLSGCSVLSNGVQVVKKQLNAGVLSGPNEITQFDFCVGDGEPDTLTVSLVGALGDTQEFVVTDDAANILEIQASGTFDFDNVVGGVCNIYSIVYSGNLNNYQEGSNLNNVTGCFLLTDSLVVNRTEVVGGSINIIGGDQDTVICVGNGMPDLLRFESNSSNQNYVYVVTDDNNVIDSILPANQIDFENTLPSECKVWGIAYTGMFTALNGDTLFVDALSSECAAISDNAIEIVKQDCPGVPVINEITWASMVELKNIGMDTVDITGFQLCNDGVYEEIMPSMINCGGDLQLAPGELVSLDLSTISIDVMDGELGLYIDNNFGSNQSIIDYVQWGGTSHLRTPVAVGAGIWTAGDAVDPFSTPNSIKYDGDGDSSTDWTEGATNLCIDNVQQTSKEGELSRVYPVPSTGMLNVELLEPTSEPIEIEIYNRSSQLIFTSVYDQKQMININLIDLPEGMYYAKIKAGRKQEVKKLMIVK